MCQGTILRFIGQVSDQALTSTVGQSDTLRLVLREQETTAERFLASLPLFDPVKAQVLLETWSIRDLALSSETQRRAHFPMLSEETHVPESTPFALSASNEPASSPPQ